MSLRLRFTLLVTGLLAAVLVAGGLWIAQNEQALAEDRIERRIERILRDSARRSEGESEADSENEPWLEGAFGEADVQVDFYLRDPEWHRVRSVSNTAAPLDTPGMSGGRGPDARLGVAQVDGRAFFVRDWESPRRGPGRRPRSPGRRAGPGPNGPRQPPDGRAPDHRPPLTAFVFVEQAPALEAEGYTDEIRTLWLGGLVALVAGALLAWFVSGAMVGPVRRAARAAEAIDRLSQRLPEGRSRDELGRLVTVINTMLGRLEAGTERERAFLGTASHEMRRPLAALVAELELAQRGERSKDDLERAIALALSDARSLGRLVDDLLSHARARAGELVISDGRVDLVELVAEHVDRCQRIVGDGATVQVGDLPEVVLRADAVALGRVVENLVMNAATHGGRGVRVDVHATNGDQGLALHVDDDGPGIPAHEQERVFESFGRGDHARSAPGAGLGLSIVRDLVLAHGGTVEVTSPLSSIGEGRGTRFTVLLPIERLISP